MTPTNLKSQAKKPLTGEQVNRIINAVTTLYASIYPDIHRDGNIVLPTPPKFYQIGKLIEYVAMIKRVLEAIVAFVREIKDIFK